jgi:hypothetical protein
LPTEDKSELYTLTESTYGIVHVTDSGKFRVAVRPNEKSLLGEKFRITIKGDDYFEFDTFEEVKEHLIDNSDESHKAQFLE